MRKREWKRKKAATAAGSGRRSAFRELTKERRVILARVIGRVLLARAGHAFRFIIYFDGRSGDTNRVSFVFHVAVLRRRARREWGPFGLARRR